MRKITKFAAITAGLALFTSACSGTAGADGSDDGPIKIGIAMKTAVQARWHHEVAVMEKIAQEQGAEVIVQWANDDITKQGNQYENLMSQGIRSEEHTSELQSRGHLVCRLLLEKTR